MFNPDKIEFKLLGSEAFPSKDGEYKEYIEEGYCQPCMALAWLYDGRKGWGTTNHAYLMYRSYNFLTLFENDDIWYCDPDTGIWRNNTVQFIKKVSPFGTFSTKGYNETISKLNSLTYADDHEWDFRDDIIPLTDGWWDIETEKFVPEYTPDMYVTKTLEREYGDPDVNYNCDRILKFLSFSLTKQGVQDFTDMLACMLHPEPRKILFVIIGDTDMGKGQMMELVDRLFGKEHTWELDFGQIASKNYHKDYFIFEIQEKKAVFIDEAEYGLDQLDIVKRLSGGSDNTPARTLGGKPSRIEFTGQILLFGNKLPTIKYDRAFFNRLKFIEVNPNDVPEQHFVLNIAKKFTEDELIGYMRMVLDRLNKFDFRSEHKETRIINNVAQWLNYGDITGEYPISKSNTNPQSKLDNHPDLNGQYEKIRDDTISLLSTSSQSCPKPALKSQLEADYPSKIVEQAIDKMLNDGIVMVSKDDQFKLVN